MTPAEMQLEKCDCVSASHHHHENEPCSKPVKFRVKVQGSSRIAGICANCYGEPFVELPIAFFEGKDVPSRANLYNLTAFDADTKQQVFQWLNVVAKDYARPGARATISHEGQDWIVIGVLYDSTATDWKVDVRKAIK